MTTVAIIQARMASTRLPGKVLEDLAGQPILEWCVTRARQIPGIDGVAVATSEELEDDPIASWCTEASVACHRGAQEDVLARYIKAGRAEGADTVIRLTADCPLLDPQVCGAVVALGRRVGADYAANNNPPTWPDGLDCEVVTMMALEAAAADATLPSQREHVTPFIRNNRKRFSVTTLTASLPGLSQERWTVDYPEDLKFLRAIVSRLKNGLTASYLDVLAVLDAEPELREINADIRRNDGLQKTIRLDKIPAERCYENSNRMIREAEKLIPLGAQTFSKSRIQLPEGQAPLFLTHGEGGRVWDIDGNEYVDLILALLPVLLGHQDPDVNDAVRSQIAEGISFSLATQLEMQLAERLVEMIPCAEMVRYGKNGTDATSGCVRVARAATGRDHIIGCGYHGWQDWYVGATSRNRGVPQAIRELISLVPYNDLDALTRALKAHEGDVACVIMEPMNNVWPEDGYLETVKEITHANGALLVFDEVICGFRIANGGGQELFGVTPDLASFGKAMGNGLPIAAVVGKTEYMREMEEIFFSSTFGGEAISLVAAIATADKVRREPVTHHLRLMGERLGDQCRKIIADHGLQDVIALRGHPAFYTFAISDHPNARKEAIKTLFIKELMRCGALAAASHSICYAHGEAEVAHVVRAYGLACETVASELDDSGLESRLKAKLIEPLFSVR